MCQPNQGPERHHKLSTRLHSSLISLVGSILKSCFGNGCDHSGSTSAVKKLVDAAGSSFPSRSQSMPSNPLSRPGRATNSSFHDYCEVDIVKYGASTCRGHSPSKCGKDLARMLSSRCAGRPSPLLLPSKGLPWHSTSLRM